jgi:hypothetical protein
MPRAVSWTVNGSTVPSGGAEAPLFTTNASSTDSDAPGATSGKATLRTAPAPKAP